MSKVVYKASCWDCQDFYIGKTKRRLHDRKTEHFKGITSACHASAIADHVTSTGHNLKWDHFEILAKGRSDTHCKIKETLLIEYFCICCRWFHIIAYDSFQENNDVSA